MYWVTTTCISCIAVPLIRDGESLYCHRSYELCNNAGGSQKLFNFIQKLYFHTTKQSKERKRFQKERESSLGLLSTCLLVMEFRFDAMLYSNLGNQKSNSAIFNVYTDFIWPAGRRLPPIDCRVWLQDFRTASGQSIATWLTYAQCSCRWDTYRVFSSCYVMLRWFTWHSAWPSHVPFGNAVNYLSRQRPVGLLADVSSTWKSNGLHVEIKPAPRLVEKILH